MCLASGRLDEAQVSVECSLRLRRSLGDRRGEGWMQERLARVHAARGAPDLARDAADAALCIAREIGDDALAAAATRPSLPGAVPGSPTA